MAGSGTVISQLGATLHIQDRRVQIPDGSGGYTWISPVAHVWASSTLASKALAAVYDMREGFAKGVIESMTTDTFNHNGWSNEACTRLWVENGPFDSGWMKTMKAEEFSSPLMVTLSDGTNAPVPVMVLGVLEPVAAQLGSAHRELVVRGTSLPSWVGAGTWYYIDGTRDSIHGTQSGAWRQDATSGSSSDYTTFTLDEYAALSEQMAGWYLQPDINRQVYLPITEADPQTHTLTTSGSYQDAGEQGTHFRIHAPASAQINGPHAGTQGQWISATSSRCLYNGYRYESPLTGHWDFQANQAANRQGGNNFAGLHYTLHRHYDPNLMRFTSPDPIASPSSNLGVTGPCARPWRWSEQAEATRWARPSR